MQLPIFWMQYGIDCFWHWFSMAAVIYQGNIDALQGRKPVGDGDCVDLVQKLTNIGHTSGWRRGARVLDLMYLNPGTVVGNFVWDEVLRIWKFPNKHGYHVGFFMDFGPAAFPREMAKAFSMMDQWKNRTPGPDEVRARFILVKDHLVAQGQKIADCDNASKYYVVEVYP